jgi:hypothetical protein
VAELGGRRGSGRLAAGMIMSIRHMIDEDN